MIVCMFLLASNIFAVLPNEERISLLVDIALQNLATQCNVKTTGTAKRYHRGYARDSIISVTFCVPNHKEAFHCTVYPSGTDVW